MIIKLSGETQMMTSLTKKRMNVNKRTNHRLLVTLHFTACYLLLTSRLS